MDAAYKNHAADMHDHIPLDYARKLERERDEARGQRDRLAEALEQLMAYQPRSTVIATNERRAWSNAKDALQSLNQPTEL